MQTIHIHGHKFDIDDDFRACLTEIWRLAGKPKNKTPYRFRKLKRNRPPIEGWNIDGWEVKGKGSKAATWVKFLVAADYAKYVGLAEKAEPKPEPKAEPQAEAKAERQAESDDRFETVGGHDDGDSWKQDTEYEFQDGDDWWHWTQYDPLVRPENRISDAAWGFDDLSHLYIEVGMYQGARMTFCVN